ncbi:hypothetical protein K3495_g954 [Podosphaera aphanis]|nr:hypothetical protein K3495_g954 [Podosphaera aphanis]
MALELRTTFSSRLDAQEDGWVPAEEFETAVKKNQEMFDGLYQTMLRKETPNDKDDPVKNEEDLREVWPI